MVACVMKLFKSKQTKRRKEIISGLLVECINTKMCSPFIKAIWGYCIHGCSAATLQFKIGSSERLSNEPNNCDLFKLKLHLLIASASKDMSPRKEANLFIVIYYTLNL